MKILIGYDGSDCANDAIEDLKFAGLPEETEAIVFSVTDAWETPESFNDLPNDAEKPTRESLDAVHSYIAEALEKVQQLAEDGATRLRALFPAWSVSAETRTGKPAWEIIEKSDEWHPDLIVVGSQGRSAIGRAILGSVSQKILHEARFPVRVARLRDNRKDVPIRILIAVDGSKCSEKAVKTVASRKWSHGTEFRIITADDNPFSRPEVSLIDYVPEGKEDSPAAKEWIKRVIETPAEILKSAGLSSKQFIRWGEARGIIIREAKDWEADCIFVGAQGMGRFKRFLLGSVSSAIAAKAGCSVEVIR